MAPRVRSARELARRHEVSVRTIERDIDALQQAGVPIYADVGRRGGYAVDRAMTLPPLNFTPAEAVAVAVALSRSVGSPFDRAARSALRKIISAMPARDTATAHALADRVRFISPAEPVADYAPVPTILEESLVARRVLRLVYQDKAGNRTEREVEPAMFLSSQHGWYLLGWCRLRADLRAFRIDRIVAAVDTGEQVQRPPTPLPADLPKHVTLAMS